MTKQQTLGVNYRQSKAEPSGPMVHPRAMQGQSSADTARPAALEVGLVQLLSPIVTPKVSAYIYPFA